MTLEEKQRLLQGIGPARPADDGSTQTRRLRAGWNGAKFAWHQVPAETGLFLAQRFSSWI